MNTPLPPPLLLLLLLLLQYNAVDGVTGMTSIENATVDIHVEVGVGVG